MWLKSPHPHAAHLVWRLSINATLSSCHIATHDEIEWMQNVRGQLLRKKLTTLDFPSFITSRVNNGSKTDPWPICISSRDVKSSYWPRPRGRKLRPRPRICHGLGLVLFGLVASLLIRQIDEPCFTLWYFCCRHNHHLRWCLQVASTQYSVHYSSVCSVYLRVPLPLRECSLRAGSSCVRIVTEMKHDEPCICFVVLYFGLGLGLVWLGLGLGIGLEVVASASCTCGLVNIPDKLTEQLTLNPWSQASIRWLLKFQV